MVKITIRYTKMFDIIMSMRQSWIIFAKSLRAICELHLHYLKGKCRTMQIKLTGSDHCVLSALLPTM